MSKNLKNELGIETYVGKVLCEVVELHRRLGFSEDAIRHAFQELVYAQIEAMKAPLRQAENEKFNSFLKDGKIH